MTYCCLTSSRFSVQRRQHRDERRSRLSGELLPNRDVLAAVARERLPLPPAPAVAQRQPRKLRLQVELRGPRVSKGSREALEPSVAGLEVMGRQALRRDVGLVQPPARVAYVEGAD